VIQTLREIAAEQLDSFTAEYGPPDDREAAIKRWMRYLVNSHEIPDDILAAMPEISRHNEPQDSPQEYPCGCVAVTHITDRDYRRHEEPFEMRLALPCDEIVCALAHLHTRAT